MNFFISLIIIIYWLVMIPTGHAATPVGIRFVVSSDLGKDEKQQISTRNQLENYLTQVNAYYKNSEVMLHVKLVNIIFSHIGSVEAVEILDDMVHEQNGFTDLLRQADRWGADYTVAITKKLTLKQKPGCGRALAVNQTQADISSTHRSFLVMNIVCGPHTLAHELGHLMGLNHGAVVDGCQPKMGHTSAIARYANGFGIGNCDAQPQSGEFGTIMVGGWMGKIFGNDKASLPIFSNPRLHDPRCGLNSRCGDPDTGDAARALNENAVFYQSHEEPDVETLFFASPALKACILKNNHAKEIEALTTLNCPNAQIDTLEGIEQLTALQTIDLSGNLLTDIRPLLALSPQEIKTIKLQQNNHLPCQALAQMKERFHDKVGFSDTCKTGASKQ